MQLDRTNLKDIDIKELALNDKFGDLKFEKVEPILSHIRDSISELDKLNYSKHLPITVVQDIDKRANKFIEQLIWLSNFSISSFPNPKQEHDKFVEEVEAFYNTFISDYVSRYIPYLRSEADKNTPNKRKLKEQEKKAREAETRYLDLSHKLEEQIKNLEGQTLEVENTSGEVAAKIFGKTFDTQAKLYMQESNKWLSRFNNLTVFLIVIVLINIIMYFLLDNMFTVEYAVLKLTLVSILFYLITFSSRQYSINSDLRIINTHRKNVGETYIALLETSQDETVRSEIAKNGAKAMFENLPSGHTSARDKETNFVNDIMNVTRKASS